MTSNPAKAPDRAKVPGSSAHCHILVAKTAQELAGTAFEVLCSQGPGANEIFKGFRDYFPEGTKTEAIQKEFVRRMWAHFIDPARTTLTALLSQPIPEVLKNEISEALILDRTLMRGRLDPSAIMPPTGAR